MRNKRNAGFTLVEIMIVVAIIGLLAAIAVPSFMRARIASQTNTCINNLRQIDGAVDQDAIENNKIAGATVSEAELLVYIKGDAVPLCPANGSYGAGWTVGTTPECSVWDATEHNAFIPGSIHVP